jgi:hypothetical protein
VQREPFVKLDTDSEVKSGTGKLAPRAWRVGVPAACVTRCNGGQSVPEWRWRAGIRLSLFVFPQDANHASQRLHPLAGKRSINFGPDGLGSLVAKLFRRE